MKKLLATAAAALAALTLFSQSQGQRLMERYAYSWFEPGEAPTDSMPVGNGDLAANVYTKGDSLYLLLSKNDAFDSNGDSIKTGRLKISLSPNPFEGGNFKQTLNIADACVDISANGVLIRVWVDANKPLYNIQISSPRDLSASVQNETWKRRVFQDIQCNSGDSLIWYHTNPKSKFAEYMNKYRIAHRIIDIDKVKDPFLNYTFANLVESGELKLRDGELKGRGKRFDIRVHGISDYTEDFEGLISKLKAQAKQSRKTSDFSKHKKWWGDF